MFILLGYIKKRSQKESNLSVSDDKNGHKNGHEDDQKPSKMKVSGH